VTQGVILFPSVHFAIRAEKLTREKGFTVKLIPVPRHLGSDCGVCLRFLWDEKDPVESLLKTEGVKMDSVHRLPG
jgi:hypothetical protein